MNYLRKLLFKLILINYHALLRLFTLFADTKKVKYFEKLKSPKY